VPRRGTPDLGTYAEREQPKEARRLRHTTFREHGYREQSRRPPKRNHRGLNAALVVLGVLGLLFVIFGPVRRSSSTRSSNRGSVPVPSTASVGIAAPSPGTTTTTLAPSLPSNVLPPTTPSWRATTTAVPITPRCGTAQLLPVVVSQQGALGTEYVIISLTNTRSTCQTGGFPGVQVNDATGRNSVNAARLGPSRGVVVLQHGSAAEFTLSGPDFRPPDGSGPPCPTSATALITPPDETVSEVLSLHVPMCAGFNVSALESSS